MDVPRCSVVNRCDEIEKLRRKKEVNARYSRLMLSKTIKQFQKQGHVTICLSEKLNGNDEKTNIRELSTNVRLSEPKNRTISFRQFPRTLKCEFQIDTNSPRVVLKSVRTQTNIEDEKSKKPLCRSNERPTKMKTSNEDLSSHVSTVGNVMSVFMRSQGQNDHSVRSGRSTITNDPITRLPQTPRKRYKSERNMMRSRNFWASYNNLFLSNRSIELRITKLFSLPNAQYIVAFSNDFFDYNDVKNQMPTSTMQSSTRKIMYQSGCVVQFMKFNLDGCICETLFVEYVIDCRMQQINCYEQRMLAWRVISLPSIVKDEFHNGNESCAESNDALNGHCCNKVPSHRCENIVVSLSILILSLFVVVLLLWGYRIDDWSFFFK